MKDFSSIPVSGTGFIALRTRFEAEDLPMQKIEKYQQKTMSVNLFSKSLIFMVRINFSLIYVILKIKI